MTVTRRAGLIVAAVCATTVLTSCGGSDSDPDVTPTSETPSAAATPTADPDGFTAEQRTLADLVTAYFTRIAARGASPVEPIIKDLVTPELLSTVVAGEQKFVDDKGLRYVGAARVDVEAVTIEGDAATVSGCYDGSAAYLVPQDQTTPSTGSQDLGYSTMKISLVRSGDGWLISQPLLEETDGCPP